MNSLDELTQQIRACQRCPLRQGATAPVAGMYNPNSKYFLIGEAPGRDEDKYGTPFIGKAGKRLDQLLAVAGIDINDCSVDNTVKCRPPKNRDPKKAEMRACLPWLWVAIKLVKPEKLIVLGSVPLSLFCSYGIRQMHGTMLTVDIDLEVKDEV